MCKVCKSSILLGFPRDQKCAIRAKCAKFAKDNIRIGGRGLTGDRLKPGQHASGGWRRKIFGGTKRNKVKQFEWPKVLGCLGLERLNGVGFD